VEFSRDKYRVLFGLKCFSLLKSDNLCSVLVLRHRFHGAQGRQMTARMAAWTTILVLDVRIAMCAKKRCKHGLIYHTCIVSCFCNRKFKISGKSLLGTFVYYTHRDSFSQPDGNPIAATSTLGWVSSNDFNCCLKSLFGWVAFCKYARQQSWA
jgi:hypothetical protein